MNIEENVLQILREAGPQGLHVTKISLHVFNGINNLFEESDFDEVHRRVNMFLIKQAKGKRPLVVRLNTRAYRELQLLLDFKQEAAEIPVQGYGNKEDSPTLF